MKRIVGGKLGDILAWARWLSVKLPRRAAIEAVRRLYRDTNRDLDHAMVLAGVARAGTTWLAEIICSQVRCRTLWEPFSPAHVPAFRGFDEFAYRRSSDVDGALREYVRRVLAGTVRGPWIDRTVERLLPEFRLVKTVRASLFLKWMHDAFPDVPLLYVVRHPCAVVLSRMEANWDPEPDIRALLAQPTLIQDYLEGKIELIKGARAVEERHAITWCILNMVPILQFRGAGLPVVFYENLCLRPDEAVPKVFDALGQTYQDSVFARLGRPSRVTSRASAVLTGQDRVSRWTQVFGSAKVRNVLAVVRAFGLEYIYGDSMVPLVTAL